MRELEHKEQKAFINWVRMAYPNLVVAAFPNGGKRHITVAAKMKAEGQLAGMPDLLIAKQSGKYPALFIEMKSKKGRMSDSQKTIKSQLESEGYKVDVCYSWAEAAESLKCYLSGEIA